MFFGVGAPSSFITTFSATENPISEGAIWLNGLADGLDWQNCQTTGGILAATHLQASPPPFDDCIACLKTSFRTFNANQFAQGTAFRVPGYTNQHEIELLLRFTISSHNAKGYEIYWTTAGLGAVNIVRWNGALNDFTPLANVGTALAVSGDVLRAEISGTVITVKLNNSTILTFDDAANIIASGNPGVGNNPGGAPSDMTSYGWTDFTADNL